MSYRPADRTLAALVSLGDDVAREGRHDPSAMPTMDERIELLLRAVHGNSSDASGADIGAARDLILDAMADDLGKTAAVSSSQSLLSAEPPGPRRRLFNPAQRSDTSAPRRFGRRLRRFAVEAIAASVVVCIGLSGVWFYLAYSAQSQLAGWFATEKQAGRHYQCSSQSLGGFPLAVTMTCREPTLAVVAEGSTLHLKAEELRAIANIFKPGVRTAELMGPLSIQGAANSPEFVTRWSKARVALFGNAANPDKLSMSFDGLSVDRASDGARVPLFRSERLELNVSPKLAVGSSMPSYEILAKLESGAFPSGSPIAAKPFGGALTAELYGVRTDGSLDTPSLLKAWQAGGGRIERLLVRLSHRDSIANANGELGLDREGRLSGSLRVSAIHDYAKLALEMAGGQPVVADLATTEKPRVRTRSPAGAPLDPTPKEPSIIGRSDQPWQGPGGLLDPRMGIIPGPQTAIIHGGTLDGRALGAAQQEIDLPIRIIGGRIYLGNIMVAEVPPLFGSAEVK